MRVHDYANHGVGTHMLSEIFPCVSLAKPYCLCRHGLFHLCRGPLRVLSGSMSKGFRSLVGDPLGLIGGLVVHIMASHGTANVCWGSKGLHDQGVLRFERQEWTHASMEGRRRESNCMSALNRWGSNW